MTLERLSDLERKLIAVHRERAAREHIPVTIFDSGIGTENYVSYVATDNRQGGVNAAERLAARLNGKGRVAVLGVIVVIRIILSFALEVEIDGTWPWRRRAGPGTGDA